MMGLAAIRVHPALLVAGLALAVYAVLFASSYDQRILTLSGVYVIMVLGYQFIFGHSGALSLAQGAFFGLGAYVTGILGSQLGTGFLLTFPLSVAAAGALAAVVAMPVLRLASHYFALATLALSQLLFVIAVNWESVTGGANGLPGVPPVTILDWQIGRGLPLLVFVWTLAALAMVIARWQLRSAAVTAFTVMRETPLAAPAFGIDPGLLRFRAFLLSAGFGGAAGALFVHTNRVVSPETLGFGVMVTCLTMTVVGGRFRIAGAVIGALLLTHLPEWFRGLDEYYLVAVGILLLAMVVFAPNGLAPVLLRAEPRPSAPDQRAGSGVIAPAAPNGLAMEGLSRRYGGVRAVDGAHLRVEPGEILGLIGPNGAGKTTLANLVSGFAVPDAGRISLADTDITGATPTAIARSGVARTFQTPQLADDLSVWEIVTTAAGNMGDTTEASVARAVEICELADTGAALCGTLPHGVRRRVEIARAIVAAPKIVILDEPAAGLSADEQDRIGRICRTIADGGAAVLLIDHNIEFLRPTVTRLACMNAGQIIAEGSFDDVLADPGVRAAYFGLTER